VQDSMPVASAKVRMNTIDFCYVVRVLKKVWCSSFFSLYVCLFPLAMGIVNSHSSRSSTSLPSIIFTVVSLHWHPFRLRWCVTKNDKFLQSLATEYGSFLNFMFENTTKGMMYPQTANRGWHMVLFPELALKFVGDWLLFSHLVSSFLWQQLG
jgi:hypothetical protein